MFPILYKPTKSGKSHSWQISVYGDTITREDGDVGGKLTKTTREIVGNTVRTAEQQAQQEAEKIWIKQLDKGYKPDEKDKKGMKIFNNVMLQKSINGGMNRGVKMFGESNITVGTTAGDKKIDTVHYPMLSQKYLEHKDSVKFPVLVQAKCDGLRCLPRLNSDGEVILESRNGKGYVHLNHIRDELKKILKPGMIIDGELYVHHLYKKDGVISTDGDDEDAMKNVERYQFLSESCKITRTKPHEYESFVQFWIFDLWDLESTNLERNKKLKKIMKGYKGDTIVLLPTHTADSHDDVEKLMDSYIEKDYEGVMLRDPDAVYVSRNGYHCRSLLKYKRESDEEWIIVGAEQCAGNQKGAVKWLCELDGKSVTAKQMGNLEDSRKLYKEYCKNPENFNGKHINIRYNELTKDGVPRFPRAVSIVEDKH